jgi:hypothetical protein
MSYNYTGTGTGQSNPGSSFKEELAIVQSVILDFEDVPEDTITKIDKFDGLYEESDYITKNAKVYGAIKFKFISHKETDGGKLPIAYPLDKTIHRLPVEQETVRIHSVSGNLYYSLINYNNSPNFDTIPTLLFNTIKTTPPGGLKANNERIDDVAKTGIANDTAAAENVSQTKLDFGGKYFKRDLRVHQLSFREGDTIVQGRFGNSIRFSGYLHDKKDDGMFHPAILIRNGENALNKAKKVYDVVNESVNTDGTSIHITSGEYISTYEPVSKFSNSSHPYPAEAKGDQIVVNSDRITISSKAESVHILSNKKLSLFANDVVSIDSNAIDFTAHGGNIFISAKDRKSIVLQVDNGKILLGSGTVDQQMILGNRLINLMAQLLDAINQMQIATPSGPSAPGPINKAPFNDVANKLKDCLSKTNYLI